MNSSGFWFRCAALPPVGLYTRGAARRMVPFSRSPSCSGGLLQTFVRPCV